MPRILNMSTFILNLWPAIMILLFAGCTIDREKSVDRDKFNFKTGDDTELFFKNVRQSDYDLEVNEAAKFQIYRHGDRNISDSVPVLNLAIVLNVLKDEAYLFLEPSAMLKEEDPLIIIQESSTGIDTLTLATQNRDTYLEFASQIYEGMQKDNEFSVLVNGDLLPVLNDPDEREIFRITTSDYYRLTRIY